MQRISVLAFSSLVVAIALRAASGCVDWANDCRLNAECCPDGTVSCFIHLDGGSDGDSGPPPACIPSQNVAAIADTCGVFVSSSTGSDVTGTGTKEAPYATLSTALASADGKPVYACGESFSEAVWVNGSARLYGALDCANGWAYAAARKTHLTAAPDAIPLRIGNATTRAEVYDFAIVSANAMLPGGSSIAALVAQASASFTRCELVAGDGAEGATGASYQTAAQPGSNGNPGNAACSASIVVPGDSVANTCGNPDSISGPGGIGQTTSGGAGSPGSPGTSMNGGSADTGSGCGPGTKGDDGDAMGLATPGLGATGIGSVSASGFTGVSGGNGGDGKPGQGGGGGGGAKGGSGTGLCSSAASAGGASGGSGGSGGCGGDGGKGGSAGGASLALVSVAATLSFSDVTLEAGHGGKGGDGGPGQNGGSGGGGAMGGTVPVSASSLKPACAGGPGGNGGAGGKGGGGLGGHAVGLAFTGEAPPATGWTAMPGSQGMGGVGDETMGHKGSGASGLTCKALDFTDPTRPTACAM